MKVKYIPLIIVLISCEIICAQNNLADFSMFSKENIEFSALKPVFYLIRQEYILTDETGKTRVRGGNNFYGKAYTIGVLTEDTRLFFPTCIRTPWNMDPTYNRSANKGFKPECSVFGMKRYSENTFFETKIQGLNEEDIITFIPGGSSGITIEDSPQNNGTLIVFYSKAAAPDDFSLIMHSLMDLEDITWNSRGIAEIEELNYGDNKIIGGILFSRYIDPGKIIWKLSGFYLAENSKWILKSVIN
ncbi:MAG TPA: hypothetical protein DDW27_05505 [Bacteroidales bacterium]|nr:hypothetical protein [Bacteroidales bacterium]